MGENRAVVQEPDAVDFADFLLERDVAVAVRVQVILLGVQHPDIQDHT